MYNIAKKQMSKVLAGLLAVVIMLSLVPTELYVMAFATELEQYSVKVVDESNKPVTEKVAITLTNKSDSSKKQSQNTENGVATFKNFVEEGETYIVSVGSVVGYKDVADSELSISEGDTETTVSLTMLEKVKISGTVESDEKPYSGATVKLDGYLNSETKTDKNGRYAFEVFKGQDYSVTVNAGDKYKKESKTFENITKDTDCSFSLSVKEFKIKTSSNENGVITESTTVEYGAGKTITATANQGYCIGSFSVNNKDVEDANNKKEFSYEIKDAKADYIIKVTFIRKTYKIKFNVGENGKVTYNDNLEIEGGSIEVEESTDPENPTKVITVMATPNKGYKVSKVIVDGKDDSENLGKNDETYSKEFEMTKDHTFSVEFAPNVYEITLDYDTDKGSAKLFVDNTEINKEDGKYNVNFGANLEVRITPEDNYNIDKVLVCDAKSDAGTACEITPFGKNSYKAEVGMISGERTIKVTFDKKFKASKKDYEVKYEYPDKTSTVGDVTYVPEGSTVTFTPNKDYKHVRINGVREYTNILNPSFKIKVGGSSSLKLSAVKKIDNVAVGKNIFTWSDAVSERIEYDNAAPTISEVGEKNSEVWHNNETTYRFEVTDNQSGVKEVKYSKEDKIENAVELTRGEDGKYSFTVSDEFNDNYFIWATDKCGNTTEVSVAVQIDKTDPKIESFEFSTEKEKIVDELINFLTFGIFCKQTIYVTVTASDKGTDEKTVSSGVNKISLYTYTEENGKKELSTIETKSNNAVFALTEDVFEEGKNISAEVFDEAGNSSTAKPNDKNVSSNTNKNVSSDYVKITDDCPAIKITPSAADYTAPAPDEKLWYAGDTAVTVKVSDGEAKTGIGSVSIKLNGVELEKDVNGKAINGSFDEKYTEVEEFVINTSQNPVDGENTIEVSVINNAGVKATATQKVYIDTTPPEILNFDVIKKVHDSIPAKILNILSFGFFSRSEIEVTVSGNDNVVDVNGNKKASSGLKAITLYAGGEEFGTKEVSSDGKSTFTIPIKKSDIVEKQMIFDANISAKAIDNVDHITADAAKPNRDNSNVESGKIMIETIPPVVSDINVSGIDQNVRNSGNIFSGDIKFNFTAQDSDSGIATVDIRINGKSYNGYPVDYTKGGSAITGEQTYNFTTEGITPDENGEYKIDVTVMDNAENITEKDTLIVKKDMTSPVIDTFRFSSNDKNVKLEDVASQEDYGYYFKEDARVKVSALDNSSKNETAAGVDSITVVLRDKDGKYYTVNSNGEVVAISDIKDAVKHAATDNSFEFVIKKSFKGQIFAMATDKVGNTPTNSTFDKTPINVVKDGILAGFKYPNGSILETEEEHGKESHIEFSREQAKYKTQKGVDLYSKNVPVEITVTDTYSGIQAIEWYVEAPYDKKNNQSGTLKIVNDDSTLLGKKVGDSGWKVIGKDKNLVTKLQKEIVVKNNSNNIVVRVKMMDRSGNVTEKKIKFSIDKTAPIIEVTYDNNTPDESYTDFFKADRSATVKITERNFNSKDVNYKITNTDGTIPSIGKWTEHKNTENPDASYYMAKILYHADGDYTFDISYADMAKNNAAKFVQHKFTIDQTKPTVSVSYDNMSSSNGNYYKADRIATITIVEHNFDSSRVAVIGNAIDNGNTVNFPNISAWTDNGDTHTATIHYSADAMYNFDIEFIDKAGNSIADYVPEEFYVDKTAPALEIGGVADKSANKGKVMPVITFADTNYNANAITYTLTGVSNGKVNYVSTKSDVTNGQKVTFADFNKVKKVDDIYTLTAKITDMAGNETTKSITFSVNRFGSSYNLATLKTLLDKYLQNEEDIVFTEINVDALRKGKTKIKLIKNGTPIDLLEGRDYTISKSGGNGKWSLYKYIIDKALFTDDGKYSVSIYTVDVAGNVNENIDETKKAEISFGVDKTEPVVIPVDFESDTQYPLEVKTVSVEIKDNLVLKDVKIYLNNTEIEYKKDGETYTFEIPEKNEKQTVRVVAVDAAGNEHEEVVENFLVSTNIFVRWFNNTPLLIGSIAGFVILCAAIVLIVILKRKKSSK